ncbi:RxLR effector protein, partial [Phytophthora megakarya]
MTAKILQIVLLMSSIALVCVEGGIPKPTFDDDQNEIHHKRHLWGADISTTSDEGNDVSEDRVINAATIKEMAETGAQIISTTTKNLVVNTKIAMMQRRTNQLFTRFKVDKVESNLLESMQFKNWAASVSNIYQNTEKSTAVMVVALTNRYGDDTLASMLTSAKEVPETNEVAVKMLKAPIDNWVTLKKPADDVF